MGGAYILSSSETDLPWSRTGKNPIIMGLFQLIPGTISSPFLTGFIDKYSEMRVFIKVIMYFRGGGND